MMLARWRSSAEAPLGPRPRADALVERVRSEVGAPGPDDRAELGVHRSLDEALARARDDEDRTAQASKDVDLARQPVGERQAQDSMAQDGDAGDAESRCSHFEGSGT